ncbi:Na+/H+ antiporter NhaA [Micavibrio aeruginosavorus]|uniref:Na(+)/H(+) antiporter NhaA n=1 Tax=Micavibrio aeruginosavorus (strain ARL-13) TaxID=856793 RepID=G2KSZ2_MICAA|nr:Na+/H+ antiporter NhaA [Micavibrio aeruginosavorus]AEP10137.1 na+/H+ antiporter NhaA [Micavibrio aeruginosavorus ARL-13]
MASHHSNHGPHDPDTENGKSIVVMMRDFFRLEAAGGIVLICASILALIIANSPLSGLYDHILNNVKFTIGFSAAEGFDLALQKSVLLWINDGLMAIFFFLIGLEIKREFLEGELSSRDRALLPALAAIGGMAVPAAVFWFLNKDSPENLAGWAIPSATDIAFALCILTLVGNRIPISLKILLTAVAVIDDLGAIIIIAIFYSHGFNPEPLYFAAVALAGLFVLNRRNVLRIAPYILLTFVLWIAVLQSGIHATLAGVIAAMFIPLHGKKHPGKSPAKMLEHNLHPWVAFLVLPLFGFANAGVPFAGMGVDALVDPVTLGIALGLLLGKQIGIFGMIFLAIKTGLSPKPHNANWTQLYGVSVICGIGFTMSLFIGGLAYHDVHMQAVVRLGVLMGSIAAAALGYCILRYGPTNMRPDWRGKTADASLHQRMTQQVDFLFGKRKGQSKW